MCYHYDDFAFMHYLQTGRFPIGYEQKRNNFNPRFDENSVPEVYIWRTRGDGRVSSEHAANNGRLFTRDNPPATGHPGQRYNIQRYISGSF